MLKKSMSSLIIASLAGLLLCTQAQAATLTVNIDKVKQGKGHLLVALYASKEAYDSGKAQASARVAADKNSSTVVFSDLPAGDYAVKLFQDENDNQKLDINMLGIPKEGYGFSNNLGRFGAPEYQDASFTLNADTAIAIELL